MAAGGAARAGPTQSGPGVAAGTPAQVSYSQQYGFPSQAGNGNNTSAQVAAILKGPGVITSIVVSLNYVVDIGFQVVNLSSRGTAPLINNSYGTSNWLGYAQAQNPAMGPAYVYPVQEVANYQSGTPAVIFTDGGGSYQSGGSFFQGQQTAANFKAGQVWSFTQSYSNGYATGGTTPGNTGGGSPIPFLDIVAVSYTYFNPIYFTDEVRVQLSPGIVWADNADASPTPTKATVGVTVNALVA